MRVHRLTRLLGLPAALMVAAGTAVAGAGAASAATCPNWTGVAPYNPPGDGATLDAIAMPSPCSAWAVGSYLNGGNYKTLVEHWNGTSWAFMLSASALNQDTFLTGVAAIRGATPWAVGYDDNGTASQTLIETPKNGVWTKVPSPDPGGPDHDNVLSAVAATSATNAWAVGRYTITPTFTLIEHWNGTKWRQVPSPNPSGDSNQLSGVAATTANDAWAVGQYTDGQNTPQTLILHWKGTRWTRVPSPNPAGPTSIHSLLAVAAVSTSSAWAVGDMYAGGFAQPLIEHWNGTRWQSVPAPSPGLSVPSVLTGVTALSSRDAWAVGYYGISTAHTLIEHWNGKAWRQVRSPSPGLSAFLIGVASSGTSIWTAGYYSNGSQAQTLALHCC